MSGHGPPQRQRTNTIGASICCVEDAETAARAATDATDATTDALLCIFNDRITYTAATDASASYWRRQTNSVYCRVRDIGPCSR